VCLLCGLKIPREGSGGIPVLIDVCGCSLAERSVRTGCVGRSEVEWGEHYNWWYYTCDFSEIKPRTSNLQNRETRDR
jgi:hypothetical protein